MLDSIITVYNQVLPVRLSIQANCEAVFILPSAILLLPSLCQFKKCKVKEGILSPAVILESAWIFVNTTFSVFNMCYYIKIHPGEVSLLLSAFLFFILVYCFCDELNRFNELIAIIFMICLNQQVGHFPINLLISYTKLRWS